jgi:hypothetical protein
MPKKYRLKNSILPDNVGAPSIGKIGYEGKVSVEDIIALEQELLGMQYGAVSLTIFIRDGKFQHSLVVKEFTRGKD